MNPASRWRPKQVFIYRHPVDMRKQLLGLEADMDEDDESLETMVSHETDKANASEEVKDTQKRTRFNRWRKVK